MELELRLEKRRRGGKGLRQKEREKVWAGIVLLHQVRWRAGCRVVLGGRGGGGRSARGDWRGLKRGVAEVDEARYG